MNQLSCVLFVMRGSKDEYDVLVLSIFEHNLDLHRRTRIQAGAETPRQSRASHRRGIRSRTITTDELGAVGGDGANRLAAVNERDTSSKFRVVWIARKKCSADRIQLSHDMHLRF